MTTETTFAGSFIAGAQHHNEDDPLEVVNPAEGRAFASVAAASAADVDAAVQAAAGAQRAWSELAVSKRGEILGRAAHHVEAHLDECALCSECYTQLVDVYGRRRVDVADHA